MKNKNQPIGIFDSGVGGLTVWRELVKSLPNESVIYYADNANCPYGPKGRDEIISLASKVVDFLVDKGCKIIIVACNTATAAAIDFLRTKYTIPFIGMEPAVKPAALDSKTKSIAVLATEGTFNGKLYLETSNKYAKDVKLNIQVGDKLVDIVEKGLINKPETLDHLSELVKPLIEKDIDYLVLGCTHYPFLIEKLNEVLPKNVIVIDPAPAVIKQTIRVLEHYDLTGNKESKPVYKFFSSGDSKILKKLLKGITDNDYNAECVL
ncbi:glutamate racemase [Bacteroidota bacterium]